MWLIHRESPTKVGTYAYVNPVVAVLVGYFLGGETLGPRTILGTLFVLIQRGGDHDDASEEAGKGTRSGRYRANPPFAAYCLPTKCAAEVLALTRTAPQQCTLT